MVSGLLMVLMEPPPDLERAFHDWFDTELVPDHLRIEGFRGASRWVCVDGWPRYMSMYDVDRVAVLEEQEYRSITGENFSAWSQWMLARVLGRQRLVLGALAPEFRGTPDDSNGLVLMRFRGRCGAAVASAVSELELPDVCTTRVYEAALGDEETVVVIDAPAVALVPAWDARSLASVLGQEAAHMVGVWRYVRYTRSQQVWHWAEGPPSSRA